MCLLNNHKQSAMSETTTPVPDASNSTSANDTGAGDTQTKKQSFRCQFCDKSLFNAQNLKYHENARVCLGQFVMCSRCLKPFQFESQLKRHHKSTIRCLKRDNVTMVRSGKCLTVKGAELAAQSDDDEIDDAKTV